MNFLYYDVPAIVAHEPVLLEWLKRLRSGGTFAPGPGRPRKNSKFAISNSTKARTDCEVSAATIADIIASNPAPAWLSKGLREYLNRLGTRHKGRPPSDIRNDVTRVRAAAQGLLSFVSGNLQVKEGLLHILDKADAWSSRKTNKRGPPEVGLGSPKRQCAAVICVAWMVCRGDVPKPNNGSCQKACYDFWFLLTGQRPAKTQSWRDTIQKVMPTIEGALDRRWAPYREPRGNLKPNISAEDRRFIREIEGSFHPT